MRKQVFLLLLAMVLFIWAMLPDCAWTLEKVMWRFAEISYQIGKLPIVAAGVAILIVAYMHRRKKP